MPDMKLTVPTKPDIQPVINGSWGFLGGLRMISALLGSMVKAKKGKPSEMRFIQSIWTAVMGKGRPKIILPTTTTISPKASLRR